MCNSLFDSAVSQFNLPTDLAVRLVTAHKYASHIEYDKNNGITNLKVNTVAHWSHVGPSEHTFEPDY